MPNLYKYIWDNILIYSRDMKQHVEHLRVRHSSTRTILRQIVQERISLEKLQFLGHMVSDQGVHVDLKKIEAVRTWKTSENVKELQQFRGFANYYNRFVPQYAKIATPLTNLLMKTTPYKWEQKHQEAVEELKQALKSAPVLILRDPECDYVIEANASDQAVGAVLMQDQGNGLQPIAYLSKKLHGAELNYPIHNKEALPIIIVFKTWKSYPEGQKTSIYTNHYNLKHLKTQPNLSRWQLRWIDFLETHFHYDIVYKPGHKNKADALSGPAHVATIQVEGMNPLLKRLFTRGYTIDPEIPLAEKRHLLYFYSKNTMIRCTKLCHLVRYMSADEEQQAEKGRTTRASSYPRISMASGEHGLHHRVSNYHKWSRCNPLRHRQILQNGTLHPDTHDSMHLGDGTTICSLHHHITRHSNHTHLRPSPQVHQQIQEGTDVSAQDQTRHVIRLPSADRRPDR
ncbi:hypothetical protein CLOP_g3586, partial [Closterium sp. NIES-67]